MKSGANNLTICLNNVERLQDKIRDQNDRRDSTFAQTPHQWNYLSSLFRFFKFSNKMNTKKFQMLEWNQLKNGA